MNKTCPNPPGAPGTEKQRSLEQAQDGEGNSTQVTVKSKQGVDKPVTCGNDKV